ncbi:biotin/lipoyl-binding protein [Ensifer sp. LCM 4579]|uniref:biotin/lipoyl-binding protein n=1 Tax=Ensifer sp. LCM 4579 TaxID=1848292 RepID=UPI0009F499A2|nr:biotin/lipoyl-binding protein [Ensifer sp. LCM 4579]
MRFGSSFWKRSEGTPRRQREDAEFLPAALEILETPASPIRASLIWLLCALATGSLVWSWVGTFDIVATSQGKIQPLRRVKVIQSLETAKVRSIPVTNGQEVKAGDLLVDLDDTELRAEADMLSISLAALEAEILRRDRAFALASKLSADGERASSDAVATDITFPEQIPPPIRLREKAVLNADYSEFVSALDRLRAQTKQKNAEAARLSSMIKAQRSLVSTLGERVAMRTSLGPFLYYPGRRLVPTPLRAFIDFIKASAGQS